MSFDDMAGRLGNYRTQTTIIVQLKLKATMTIETKFNVDDMAFVLATNKVHEVRIIGVNVQCSNTIERIEGRGCISGSMLKQYVTYRVKYLSGGESIFDEADVFATKKDLLKSL